MSDTSTKQIQDAIIAANLTHHEIAGMIAFLTGVYESRVATAEALADSAGASSLTTPEWSAQRFGRSDLVDVAQSLTEAAQRFASGERGTVPALARA
jgi:hypothetical protein